MNEDPGFYSLMGPYLSRREIVKELGFPVFDDDGKRWTIALDGAGRVLGFGSLSVKGDRGTLSSDYVLPEHRGHGLYHQIVEERIAYASAQGLREITVMATLRCSGILETYGFRPERSTVQYVKMALDLRDPSLPHSSNS